LAKNITAAKRQVILSFNPPCRAALMALHPLCLQMTASEL